MREYRIGKTILNHVGGRKFALSLMKRDSSQRPFSILTPIRRRCALQLGPTIIGREGFISIAGHEEPVMNVNKAEILRSIRREQRNSAWIDRSMLTLRKKFGDRYIAVKNRKVIDSDEDFETLLSRIRKDGNPESATFEFVTVEECIWVP
jgi:hypothetical protein